MNETVKHYFATYTQSNDCFETSDGFLFHRATDAAAHAQTLENKRVKPYTRDEVEDFIDDEEFEKNIAERHERLKASIEADKKASEETEQKGESENLITPLASEHASVLNEFDGMAKVEEEVKVGDVVEGLGAKVVPIEEEEKVVAAPKKNTKK